MNLVLLIGLVFVALALGPLLGVVADRAVEREALQPEHRCVHCRAGQGTASLLPVAHWFGHCQACLRSEGVRYPAIDLALVVSFVAVGHRFGVDELLLPYLGLATVLVVLSAIDFETHLLPNIIVWPSIWLALFMILVLSGERNDVASLYSALLGGAVFGGFIGIAHLVSERGMGRGDVKLALLLGLFVGWLQPDRVVAVRLVFYAIILALLGGGIAGLGYNLASRRGRAEIPFGPALASASLVVIVVSPHLG